MPEERRPVPWRTIFATIAAVLVTGLAVLLLRQLTRVLSYIVVAGFFAVILNPAVDFLEHRAKIRRWVSTLLVFLTGLGLLAAMMYAFVRPIIDQSQEFADKLPEYVEDARRGEGAVGELVKRYDIDEYLEENEERFQRALRNAGRPALEVARSVFNTVFAVVTIMVLTYLMLLEAPNMLQGGLQAIPEHHRERVRRVASDCARALSGYMAGNLIISVIAGGASFLFLTLAGVPFKEVLALWVAFADLIPLVGATLGAVPAVGVAFIDSVPVGIATVIFFIVYQQFENHVLQVTIMSRTVDINPLMVLVSVLIGVEIFGILGALLAIPAAGVVQVIARDLWDEHQGRPKDVPTVGVDETPIPEPADGV